MFSAVICTYINDHSNLLKKALESIYKQDLLPSEVILVKDGPINPEAHKIILNFIAELESRKIPIKLHAFNENVGHGEARRAGINFASNDIIAICDADDINYPNRFIRQYNFLIENKQISAVGANIIETNRGKSISIKSVPSNPKDIMGYCRFRCPINQMTVMFRKKDIEAVGGYRDFYHNEDYFLWIRLIKNGYQLANIPEVLVEANVDPQTFKRRGGLRYYRSEFDIQILLLRYNITNAGIFLLNITVRIFIQLLIPSSLREVIFKKIFRNKI